MHSFVGLNKEKEPIMDMQTCADSRSASVVRAIKSDGNTERIFLRTNRLPDSCMLSFS